jgi:hypothetical protein
LNSEGNWPYDMLYLPFSFSCLHETIPNSGFCLAIFKSFSISDSDATVSGLRNKRNSPEAFLAPRLQPLANPPLI